MMTLSSPAGSFAASLGSQENRDRTKSCLYFFVLTNWTRKADEENSPVDCFPAVARKGESVSCVLISLYRFISLTKKTIKIELNCLITNSLLSVVSTIIISFVLL